MGTLYYGDNLDILRRYLKDETVDLVYLGKGIDRPSTVAATDETFKKAPESGKKHGEQKKLAL